MDVLEVKLDVLEVKLDVLEVKLDVLEVKLDVERVIGPISTVSLLIASFVIFAIRQS